MLKLEMSLSEQSLRSVGDPPNGILVVTFGRDNREPGYAIDGRAEPKGGGVHIVDTSFEEMPPTIEVADAVSACAGAPELKFLWWSAERTVTAAVAVFLEHLLFDRVRLAVDFAESVAVAIEERLG